MRKINWQAKMFILLFVLVLMAACGKAANHTDEEVPAVELPPEPVELSVYLSLVYPEDRLNLMLVEPLKQKYPHITLRFFRSTEKGQSIAELVAAGSFPDVFVISQNGVGNFANTDLLENMTPLLERQKVDLHRFEQSALDSIRSTSAQGHLYALPFDGSGDVLHYNKSIFNKFGAPYPPDGMTWGQAMELAKQVSRIEDGVQYYGLGFDGPVRLAYSLSMLTVDAKTNKATIDNEQWRKVFNLARNIYAVPNNMPEKDADIRGLNIGRFRDGRDIAMIVRVNGLEALKDVPKTDLDWDIAQAPSWDDQPGVYSMLNMRLIGVTNTTKHKEDALRVVEVITSDEIQLKLARQFPAISLLKNSMMKEQFAADIPELKDKNVQAVFKSRPAPGIAYSVYHDEIYNSMLRPAFIDYIRGKKDLNTALREAEDAANKKLLELAAR